MPQRIIGVFSVFISSSKNGDHGLLLGFASDEVLFFLICSEE